MSEGKSVPKGTPPKSVQKEEEKLSTVLSGTANKEEENKGTVEEESAPTPEAVPRKALPKKKAILSNDIFDVTFSYIDVAETEIAVIFLLPDGEDIAAKPKKAVDFKLDCEDLPPQSVTYIGESIYFKVNKSTMFLLLKTIDDA